jgi:hypothetical protein
MVARGQLPPVAPPGQENTAFWNHLARIAINGYELVNAEKKTALPGLAAAAAKLFSFFALHGAAIVVCLLRF